MHIIICTAYIAVATIKSIKLMVKKLLNDPRYGLTTNGIYGPYPVKCTVYTCMAMTHLRFKLNFY